MTDIDDKIDQFEAMMLKSQPMVNCELRHLFVPGMYIRKIIMPKGIWVTSLVHNTVHPFFVQKGKVSVFSEIGGEELLEGGHMGVTTPGTRRVLYMHKTTEWTTCHSLPFITGEENDLSEEDMMKIVSGIEDLILEPHENKLLGGVIKNNILTKSIKNEKEDSCII